MASLTFRFKKSGLVKTISEQMDEEFLPTLTEGAVIHHTDKDAPELNGSYEVKKVHTYTDNLGGSFTARKYLVELKEVDPDQNFLLEGLGNLLKHQNSK